MQTRLALAVLVLALAACSGGGGGRSSPTVSGSPSLPAPSVEPPIVSPTLHIDRPPDDEMHLTGSFGFDSVEGGCGYLQTDDKTRYEIIWPPGWSLSGSRLRNPAGDIAARAGDTMTVRGSVQRDMASICQIGPIFRVSEIITIGQ